MKKILSYSATIVSTIVVNLAIPTIVLSSLPLISQPALADTVSFTFLQAFSKDGSTYKVMVRSRNGNRYFVWYFDSLCQGNNCPSQGSEVLIEINGNSWRKISNPQNGRSSNIWKVNKVE